MPRPNHIRHTLSGMYLTWIIPEVDPRTKNCEEQQKQLHGALAALISLLRPMVSGTDHR